MKYLFLLGCCFAVSAPVMAQELGEGEWVAFDARNRENTITVVASGEAENISQTAQSITVIGAEEITSIQGPDLTRVLERAPGVTITRNGGVGGFTGVRVRGADAEQLLVLVDGVRLSDAAAPGGGFDFGNLLSGNIGKIELLRGSNSVVWGSQAIGGVLAVTTRSLEGVEVSGEYGAQDSVYATAAAGLVRGGFSASLAGGFRDSDGISAAASGTEPDGFRQWQLTGKTRLELAGGFALTANGRYAEGSLDIDGYPAPNYSFADTPEYQETREASGRVGAEYVGENFDLGAGFSLTDTQRDLFDPTYDSAPNFRTKGRGERAELSGQWRVAPEWKLDFGADSEWTRYSTTYDTEKKARLSSAHALLSRQSDDYSLAAGIRVDDHSAFGSEVTFGANASYRLAADWRVRASYGEGFKAPTLFQLLSDYGNAALTPERSRSYDIGIEQGDRNSPLHFALTAFRRDSRDLIDFVSCASLNVCATRPYGTYDNVRSARAEGFEAEADAAVSETLRVLAAYSYVKAVNRASGNDLARRPRHALSVSGDWTTPLADLALGADLRLVADSFDDAGNFTPLDGYALVTLRASLPVGEAFELYGRIENLADVRYQTVAGYGTPGRSVFVGARARF